MRAGAHTARASGPALRGVVIVLALAAASTACAGQTGSTPDPTSTPSSATSSPGSPAASADQGSCQPEQRPAEQSGGHLLGEATPPVPYSSTPPTSGWHASGAPRHGVHGDDDPLSEPEQVTVLELGGVVLTWKGLDSGERARLEAFAAEHSGVVAVTPYERLAPGQTAMTAWGVLRLCQGVEPAAVAAFIAAHRGGGPEH